jgi:hypothetical protein
LQQIGSDTRIDIDRNGKRSGGNTPLAVVNNITVANLERPGNFIF